MVQPAGERDARAQAVARGERRRRRRVALRPQRRHGALVAAVERQRQRLQPVAPRSEPDEQRARVGQVRERREQQVHALLRDQLAQVPDERARVALERAERRGRAGVGARLVVGGRELGPAPQRRASAVHRRADRRRPPPPAARPAIRRRPRAERRRPPATRRAVPAGTRPCRRRATRRPAAGSPRAPSRRHGRAPPWSARTRRSRAPCASAARRRYRSCCRTAYSRSLPCTFTPKGRPAVARPPVRDGAAGDDVAGDHAVGAVPRDGRPERGHVARQIALQLVVGEVDERHDAIEALVLVVDEHRAAADRSTDGGARRGRLPAGTPDSVIGPTRACVVDLAPPVQEREALGVAFLGDDQHVVARAPQRGGDPRGRDVRPRSAQEPAVPQQDSRRRPLVHAQESRAASLPAVAAASLPGDNPPVDGDPGDERSRSTRWPRRTTCT